MVEDKSSLVDDIGFDDDSINGSKIPFYKGERNRIDQITFPFPKGLKRARVHYHKDLKYFHCTGGYCCGHVSDFGYAANRVGTSIIRWEVGRDSMPVKPYRGNVEVWFISEDKYVDIKMSNKRYPVTDNDILVRCTEEQYQKLSIQTAAPSVLKAEDLPAELKTRLMKEAEELHNKVENLIAKNVPEEKLKEVRGDVVIPQVEGVSTEAEFDDMIDNLPGGNS